jgi:hypothetical protein
LKRFGWLLNLIDFRTSLWEREGGEWTELQLTRKVRVTTNTKKRSDTEVFGRKMTKELPEVIYTFVNLKPLGGREKELKPSIGV